MSHLLTRISKLSSSSSSPLNRRLCFRRSDLSTAPYLFLGRDVVEKSPCGGRVVNFKLYDPTKEELVKLENQKMPKNLSGSSTTRIGSSRGWLALMKTRDSTVHLTNIFDNNRTTISLPPLIKDKTERILNVSVSQDGVVAARFYGSRLSLCGLGDSEWTRVDVTSPVFGATRVTYSDKDRKFYLNSWLSDSVGAINFTSKPAPVSGYVRFPLSNFPEMDKFFNFQQHLVHSPSGDTFIVLWAVDPVTDKGKIVQWEHKMHKQDDIHIKTHKIYVYKQDTEKRECVYTQDIGDLCIFVGENEPFVLSTSDYPGLKPNSVYFAGYWSGYGVCDLASSTIRYLSGDTRLRRSLFWLPPTTTQKTL